MDPQIKNLVDISQTPVALRAHADIVLERAKWAAQVFSRFDRRQTQEIADAVARAAFDKAREYAEWAVRETGFGVVDHKVIKNESTSVPLVEHYRDWNFVDPRLDERTGLVEIPRPAGVVFALIPSTNPVATVYFKVLSCLLTRNAIVVSPHPAAKECCIDAAKMMAQAAVEAGAPDGIIQVVEEISLPLVDEFMKSDKTAVILATGGTAMVRAAYSSANPAIGVGPGNAPVFVDETADIKQAAGHIVDSKSFDNSILCTNESVLVAMSGIASRLESELKRHGAHICNEEQINAVRKYLFHERGFNVEAIGRDAVWIAAQAGFKVPAKTRILVTPITQIGIGERLSREKLCPVLAMYTARSLEQAVAQSRAMLRLSGAGHSAAIHSDDTQTITDFAAAVECYRVVVNGPCSQGAAGMGTGLAPTFTIGTGFFGRSSIGENIGPQHLVNWTRIAWNQSDGKPDLERLGNLRHRGPLPAAPSDGVPGKSRAMAGGSVRAARSDDTGSPDAMRNEIRRIIAEELRDLLKG